MDPRPDAQKPEVEIVRALLQEFLNILKERDSSNRDRDEKIAKAEDNIRDLQIIARDVADIKKVLEDNGRPGLISRVNQMMLVNKILLGAFVVVGAPVLVAGIIWFFRDLFTRLSG